jgi:hypothetical protein
MDTQLIVGNIELSNSERCLIAGLSYNNKPGGIRCYLYPFDGQYIEYQAHDSDITKIKITHDDS